MNCCEDQKSEKKPSIQPKSPQAKLPQTGYQKRAVQRREEKINVDIQPEQKEQSQHLFDFRRQLERDVNTNKHQLNQLIDRIDNIPDFTEYQKIQQQIIDINFKSIGKYLLTSINQNSTDSIVEQMHQPYHLLIQVKKQLKFQALSFIYFLQKIQELINQGIIRDNQIFENNKKKLRQIDSKVCKKLEQVIERVKLLQKRKKHEDESSSEVKEGSVKIEYNLKHEIQLKNERIHTLALQKQRLKTQNEMYETKLNPMHKAIQAMNKNISSICQKLQVSPSISSATSKYDFENEQKWKKTMSELQFNRNEVIRLKQQLADSQKRLSEITVTSESSNIKNISRNTPVVNRFTNSPQPMFQIGKDQGLSYSQNQIQQQNPPPFMSSYNSNSAPTVPFSNQNPNASFNSSFNASSSSSSFYQSPPNLSQSPGINNSISMNSMNPMNPAPMQSMKFSNNENATKFSENNHFMSSQPLGLFSSQQQSSLNPNQSRRSRDGTKKPIRIS